MVLFTESRSTFTLNLKSVFDLLNLDLSKEVRSKMTAPTGALFSSHVTLLILATFTDSEFSWFPFVSRPRSQ